MLRFFHSTYVWIIILIITFIFAPVFIIIWLLTGLFDRRLLLLHQFSNIWGSAFTILVPGWKVTVIGKEKLNTGSNKIIVANHQSLEDILIVYRIGVPFRWISKAEVFKIPIYGWLMNLKGDIKLQRSSKASIKKMLLDAEYVLNKGCSIAMFPEGTRSKTGELGNFKEGAFNLALKTKKSIIPIVIYGTGHQFIYSNFFFKGKHRVILKVLDEIPYTEFQNWESKELTGKVRDLIRTELDQLKRNR